MPREFWLASDGLCFSVVLLDRAFVVVVVVVVSFGLDRLLSGAPELELLSSSSVPSVNTNSDCSSTINRSDENGLLKLQIS